VKTASPYFPQSYFPLTNNHGIKRMAHRDIKGKKEERKHTKSKRKIVEKVTLKFKEESF